MKLNFLNELTQRVVNALPADMGILKQDLEKNLHAALQQALAKMDLVTRKEFDVQCAVLARTREKLEALEKQVAELEAQIKGE